MIKQAAAVMYPATTARETYWVILATPMNAPATMKMPTSRSIIGKTRIACSGA